MERWLVRRFPLGRPHRVNLAPYHLAGTHQIRKGTSIIRIDSEMPDYAQGWTLIHEWAHARERGRPKKGEPHHGKRWGREYWPIYSAWFDFD